jgi:CHASE1-domain containing sensor protein
MAALSWPRAFNVLAPRYLVAAAVLAFGLAASLTVFVLSSRSDEQERQAEFNALAEHRINTLRASLDQHLHEVHSLKAFFTASHAVTRSEFGEFAEQLLLDNDGIQALEWIPRVVHEQRQDYEARARQDGLGGFTIQELDELQQMRPALTRPEYYPVYYVEPCEGNVRALGFDLASDPTRLSAIQIARETRNPAATDRITLVQGAESRHAVLVFFPIHLEDDSFAGLVLGVLQISTVLEVAMSRLQDRPIEVTLSDVSSDFESVFLASTTGVSIDDRATQAPVALTSSAVLTVADRTWLVRCRPSPGSPVTRASHLPVALLILGIFLTTSLAVLLVYRATEDEKSKRHQAELAHLSRVATAGELAASLAHELNQPLCAIVLNAQTARRMADDLDSGREAVQTALGQIVQDGERAGATIQNLRDFLRKGTVVRRPVQMDGIIREAIAMVRASDLPGIQIDLQLDPSLPRVMADPVQIQQVVLNLLRNGLESMQGTRTRHRPLTVRVAFDGEGTVTTTVRDTGKGLEGLTDEELFSPFFTTKDQGMGIGLSISRTIIESHDGKIWAVARDGAGATFAFSLPAAEGR